MIFRSVLPRPGHTSEIKTNYKSAYVGALEPIMAELTEVGDASSSSTVDSLEDGGLAPALAAAGCEAGELVIPVFPNAGGEVPAA